MNTVPTVSDAKRDFFHAFPQPISAVYRKIVDELLVELHLLTVNQAFRYDSIFALGVVTVFDRFMEGYPGDLLPLEEALFKAVRLSAQQLRQDANRVMELARYQSTAVKQLLTTLEANGDGSKESAEVLTPLAVQLQAIRANPQFKYSRLFAVGLFTLTETIEADQERQTDILKQCCQALYPPPDRFLRDLDLYRSNLDKVQQAKQMMADLVEAEKKKKAKATSS